MLHHNFKRGKRAFIVLKNGEKLVDKYIDTKSNYIIFKDHVIPIKDIRSATIYKGDTNEEYK